MDYKNRLAAVADTLEGVKAQADALPVLPSMTNPAEENDVLMGKEFVGEDGSKKEGALPLEVVTPGWETFVPVEKAYDSSDVFLRMTSLDGFGDAEEADVAAGKTFTNAQGVAKVGTAQTGGGMETVHATFTIYGEGTVYYMGTDGIATLANPYEETVEVVKGSPVIVWYWKYGGTYLVLRDSSGGETVEDSSGLIAGHSVSVLAFQEDGHALYEEV